MFATDNERVILPAKDRVELGIATAFAGHTLRKCGLKNIVFRIHLLDIADLGTGKSRELFCNILDHSDQKAKALLFLFPEKHHSRISDDRVDYLVLLCNLAECWRMVTINYDFLCK